MDKTHRQTQEEKEEKKEKEEKEQEIESYIKLCKAAIKHDKEKGTSSWVTKYGCFGTLISLEDQLVVLNQIVVLNQKLNCLISA